MNYGGGYESTSYGGGYDGGGGFTNFGGSQQGSQASPSSRANKISTLRPVTIKQLREAQQPHPDTDFRLDDADLSHITFVAQIRNTTHQTTNILYTLDDGTGTVEAKYWVNKEGASDVSQTLHDGDYVRIMGTIKSFNNKKHVTAQVIRQVTDFNEIPYHFLEAVATHLHFTRGPKNEGGAGSNGDSRPTNLYGVKQEDTAMGGTSASYLFGLSAGAQKVVQVLRKYPDTNEGVNVSLIAQQAKMSLHEVRQARDELVSEGRVYTTHDEDHLAYMEQD